MSELLVGGGVEPLYRTLWVYASVLYQWFLVNGPCLTIYVLFGLP